MKAVLFLLIAVVIVSISLAQSPLTPVPVKPWEPERPNNSTPVLSGTWLREFDGIQVILKFTEKRAFLDLRVALKEGNENLFFTVRLSADYAVSPDGVIFGHITGADFVLPALLKKMDGNAKELASFIRGFEDEPFSVRYRIDENRLSIRDARVRALGEPNTKFNDETFRAILTGEFKSVSIDKISALKPLELKSCILTHGKYDSDPNARMSQLLNESEDLRNAREEWHRFWMNNQPSVLTYERLNGAIGP